LSKSTRSKPNNLRKAVYSGLFFIFVLFKTSPMKNKSLVSINDFTREEHLRILDLAGAFERNPRQRILEDYVVATLFFEPSTRTRLSFESAASRLGAQVIGFSDSSSSSTQKGESLRDTIKTVANYSDIIIMRHPREGSARFASEVSSVPIINAGDGSNQHPTQTLLDLYSIRKTQGTLDNLNIGFVGDLKYGRTVHSLVMAFCNYNTTFHLVSPLALKPSQFGQDAYQGKGTGLPPIHRHPGSDPKSGHPLYDAHPERAFPGPDGI
jgi:aspartate carbamoyltransferase catalytic subunit